LAQSIGDNWRLNPIEIDPPDHAKYRQLLNPLFSPARIAELSEAVIARANDLTRPLRLQSEFEFLESFATPFPVSIFLELIGLSTGEMKRFVGIAERIGRGRPEMAIAAIRELRNYMRGQISERRSKPGKDVISHILAKKVDDRSLNDDEMTGMCFNLFLGGLDTVRSALGYAFRYLAEHPDQQRRLRDNAALIPDAAEELLCAHSVVTTARRATRDVQFAGVSIRAGDNIAISTSLASRDPGEFSSPEVIDFARSPNRHSVFGFGIHRCLGSHLARREIVAAIQVWTSSAPAFQLADGRPPQSSGAGVVGLNELYLRWVN
jgi:cytochrome P450